jgi:hypothetical protein
LDLELLVEDGLDNVAVGVPDTAVVVVVSCACMPAARATAAAKILDVNIAATTGRAATVAAAAARRWCFRQQFELVCL